MAQEIWSLLFSVTLTQINGGQNLNGPCLGCAPDSDRAGLRSAMRDKDSVRAVGCNVEARLAEIARNVEGRRQSRSNHSAVTGQRDDGVGTRLRHSHSQTCKGEVCDLDHVVGHQVGERVACHGRRGTGEQVETAGLAGQCLRAGGSRSTTMTSGSASVALTNPSGPVGQ